MPTPPTGVETSTKARTSTQTKMTMLFAGGIILGFVAIRFWIWVTYTGHDIGSDFPLFRGLDDVSCFFLNKGC